LGQVSTEPPFRSIGIVGLGLIGGSIALASRRAWPDAAIVGVDRMDVLDAARGRDAVTETRARIEDLTDVDLIVLAAPVPEIASLVGAIAKASLPALVTDVGSTKRHIVAAADRSGVRFVGGHPIAGAATGGLGNARADLFERRDWLIVPNGAAEADVDRLSRFVRALGGVVRKVQADAHDRLMAYVSHLPQLLATTLMTTAAGAVGKDGLAAAGPGFADMTRLASSPADIWRGILATNGDYIAEALRALADALPLADGKLADPARLDAMFQKANEWAGRT
jgi:prephenate dehydrogenase